MSGAQPRGCLTPTTYESVDEKKPRMKVKHSN